MPSEQRPLSDLPTGSRATVCALPDNELRRRLMDLGFIEGTSVVVLQRSLSGDPTAYEVRSTVIALRREDACGIMMTCREQPLTQPVKGCMTYGAM